MDKLEKLCHEPAYVFGMTLWLMLSALLIILAAVLVPGLVGEVNQLDAIDKQQTRKWP